MKMLIAATLASLTLAGCGTLHPTAKPVVDQSMVAKVNADLAMPLSDTQVQDLADKTCRDFSYLYTTASISNYIQGFAAINTHNSSSKSGHALGAMLGSNCPATAKRILHIIEG